eukprot:CAMPEP_0117439718 /NCGR_PEP_ID=MMETSP0759-20121206/2708_1 /TAXON_ID=63605 /ORGANISM="Percolomonas cosmopolitus, Strain WS" /LENGTH=139 /DNA_ID=CAMNT_0005231439 /DNA_START=489 /DNA_END=908 /DNA_ORIENTATION=+
MVICETPSGSTYTFNSDQRMDQLSQFVRDRCPTFSLKGPSFRGGGPSNIGHNALSPLSTTSSAQSLDSKHSFPQSDSQPDLGVMEFRKFLFGSSTTCKTIEEKIWTVAGSGLRRRDFMKEVDVVSNQEKGKLSYILNPK